MSPSGSTSRKGEWTAGQDRGVRERWDIGNEGGRSRRGVTTVHDETVIET